MEQTKLKKRAKSANALGVSMQEKDVELMAHRGHNSNLNPPSESKRPSARRDTGSAFKRAGWAEMDDVNVFAKKKRVLKPSAEPHPERKKPAAPKKPAASRPTPFGGEASKAAVGDPVGTTGTRQRTLFPEEDGAAGASSSAIAAADGAEARAAPTDEELRDLPMWTAPGARMEPSGRVKAAVAPSEKRCISQLGLLGATATGSGSDAAAAAVAAAATVSTAVATDPSAVAPAMSNGGAVGDVVEGGCAGPGLVPRMSIHVEGMSIYVEGSTATPVAKKSPLPKQAKTTFLSEADGPELKPRHLHGKSRAKLVAQQVANARVAAARRQAGTEAAEAADPERHLRARLSRMLRPKTRRWCVYEFFYSPVDHNWLRENDFIATLEAAGCELVTPAQRPVQRPAPRRPLNATSLLSRARGRPTPPPQARARRQPDSHRVVVPSAAVRPAASPVRRLSERRTQEARGVSGGRPIRPSRPGSAGSRVALRGRPVAWRGEYGRARPSLERSAGGGAAGVCLPLP